MFRWNKNKLEDLVEATPPHAKDEARARPAPKPKATTTLDPYFRWAKASAWRGIRRMRDPRAGELPEKLRIIARARDETALKAALKDSHLQIPDFYREDIPGTHTKALFFTASVDWAHVKWLESDMPAGITWELAVPFRDAESAAQGSDLSLFGVDRERSDFEAVAPLQMKPVKASAKRPNIRRAIAVIDFGCPFLNDRFAQGEPDERKTRLAALWDQGAAPERAGSIKTPWVAAARAGYGRELSGEAMNQLLERVRHPGKKSQLDEVDAYKAIDYLVAYDDPRRRVWGSTHGGHVLDVAGGEFDPLTGKRDAAGEAPLVFVQLPALTAADSSGGSLSAQLLDAVRYVLHVCEKDAPIIVNISYGTFAGPHDGTSMIEQALDELLEARGNNFAIVIGAGNARQSACHLKRTVRRNRSAVLRIDLADDDTTDTFVEIWYDPRAADQAPLEARVRTAGRDWSRWVAADDEVPLCDAALGEPVALLRHDRSVPNGAQSLILLALAPTRQPADDDQLLAPAGRWEVELRIAGSAGASASDEVTFDAWIERDDPGDFGSGAQSTFAGTQFDDANETLSSLATGKHTIVVGGFRRSDAMPLPYSSTGSRLGRVPLFYAACEEDELQPGIRAAAVRSNETFLMNGTSVAAPVVARRLFNCLMEPIVAGDANSTPQNIARNRWKDILEKVVDLEYQETEQRPVPAEAVKRAPS